MCQIRRPGIPMPGSIYARSKKPAFRCRLHIENATKVSQAAEHRTEDEQTTGDGQCSDGERLWDAEKAKYTE